MSRPKLVTIGLITFNGAPTIRRAIDSLLAQTYKNFELLISDNASTDKTADICREYAARDPRIRYIRQEKNLGAAGNLYFAPHAARGEYFMWAADDDWWDKTFVETLVSALERHPEYGIAMSSYNLVNPDGTLRKRVSFSGDLDLCRQGYRDVFKKMIFDQPIHVSCYGVFRKDFMLKLLGRGIPKCARHDRILMCEAALSTRIFTVPEVLFKKTRNEPILERERYRGDHMAAIARDPLARSRYYLTLLSRLLTSGLIPVERKFTVPFSWAGVVWLRKRRILGEISGVFLGKFLS